MRIDLGCGTKKQPGFLGVDRYPLAGVDVVADINRNLPFRNDSVDLLLASHSLEHVEKLLATIAEVYRICKHGAQLCVVAPYSEQKLNWANPYHTWAFNEHTPRFWTDYPDAPIDPDEYRHPHASTWGLSRTDNSNPGFDIRIARMECFYFPRYACLPPSEQRRMRQDRTDVCDQIMYHLIVWKGDGKRQGRSFDDDLARFQPYEPEYITLHREHGRKMLLQNGAAACEVCIAEAQVSERLRQEITGAKEEANQLRDHSAFLTREIARLHQDYAAQTDVLGRMTTELHDTAAYNRILRDETVRVERDLEFARAELSRESAAAATSRAELETTATLLGLQRQKAEGLCGEITAARRDAVAAAEAAEQWKTLWSMAKRALSAVAVETRLPEFSQVARLGGFIIGRDRQAQGLPNGFVPLREYSDRHFHSSRACIVLGGDLAEVAYREYVIPFALDRLTAVSLAIRPLVPKSPGVLGVEIVSARSEIQAQVHRDLTTIDRDGVAEFRLQVPLTGLEENWFLRVFVHHSGTPVSVYELLRGALFRGTTQSFPLVSFS
jgi:SAM-dependent methyltransferase